MSKQDTRPNAAEALAAVTGHPKAKFAPDLETYPLPDPDTLERIPAEDVSHEE